MYIQLPPFLVLLLPCILHLHIINPIQYFYNFSLSHDMTLKMFKIEKKCNLLYLPTYLSFPVYFVSFYRSELPPVSFFFQHK